ncbi:MAG: formylglycine-generating enzyme family protein [Ferrovum sp.]|nr:formylglycine-generating enzyme family protein [Ferrovum sp.]NDU86881.1 formylglycine-generating enzyme family protein [Ferrovum sp.]
MINPGSKILGSILLLWSLTAMAAPAGSSISDCPDCPEMVAIPAGNFTLNAGGKVTFAKPFFMSASLVTQGQWRAIMHHNPSAFPQCGDNCPVDRVSWEDVQVYILRLNAKTGQHYRLPSESEWGYACRAGLNSTYCGGDQLDPIAWYDQNSDHRPHPVATKAPNGWGLYDMTGNLWEWMEDCYQDTRHINQDDQRSIPDNGAAWEGNAAEPGGECLSRVVRGGSWRNNAQDMALTRRSADDPLGRVETIGFRLVRGQ